MFTFVILGPSLNHANNTWRKAINIWYNRQVFGDNSLISEKSTRDLSLVNFARKLLSHKSGKSSLVDRKNNLRSPKNFPLTLKRLFFRIFARTRFTLVAGLINRNCRYQCRHNRSFTFIDHFHSRRLFARCDHCVAQYQQAYFRRFESARVRKTLNADVTQII